jgi:hypothetical protein
VLKALAAGLMFWVACQVPLVGQERDDRSLARIAVALQQPRSFMRGIDAIEAAEPRTFGIFTLVRPELPGEFIRVSVPIGELVSRAARGVSVALQQRQEQSARRRVEADMKWFAAQRPQ